MDLPHNDQAFHSTFFSDIISSNTSSGALYDLLLPGRPFEVSIYRVNLSAYRVILRYWLSTPGITILLRCLVSKMYDVQCTVKRAIAHYFTVYSAHTYNTNALSRNMSTVLQLRINLPTTSTPAHVHLSLIETKSKSARSCSMFDTPPLHHPTLSLSPSNDGVLQSNNHNIMKGNSNPNIYYTSSIFSLLLVSITPILVQNHYMMQIK